MPKKTKKEGEVKKPSNLKPLKEKEKKGWKNSVSDDDDDDFSIEDDLALTDNLDDDDDEEEDFYDDSY